MKSAAVIGFLLAKMIIAHAQSPQFKWVTAFGSNEFVYSTAILTDDNGNLYTLGYFSGTHDFDPGPGVYNIASKGSTDIYILKTDPGGNFLWAGSMGGTGEEIGFSMVRDINGNIFISGRFQFTADLDPGAGTQNRTAQKYQDMFICKLNSTGNFLWAVTIPGIAIDNANFLSADNNGNVIMTGNFTGYVDFNPGVATAILYSEEPYTDVFVLKIDAAGNFVWVKQVQIELLGFVFDIAADPSGNVYVTGNFRGTVDFDPNGGEHLLTSNGDLDVFILKLDDGGNFLWVENFGGAGMDDGTSIDVDNMGNVYATGDFSQTVDFDPGPGVYNLVNASSYAIPYILKLDASGNLIWAQMIDNDFSVIQGLAINYSGEVFITGHFRQTLDFDPSVSTDDLTANETDMFLAKFSTDGVFEWSEQVTGPGNDYGLELAVDKYDNVFTTGIFHGTADFDPGAGTQFLTSSDEGDVYILKTGFCPAKTASNITQASCNSYTLNDHTYTTSGIYTQTLITPAGCDSTITLNLTISETIRTDIAKSICEGQSFEGHSTAGTYTNTYATQNGCDSIRTLTLSVVGTPTPNLGQDVLLCPGDSLSLYPGQFDTYSWQDGSRHERFLVKEAGTYSVNVQGACGVASDVIVVKYGPCGIFFPTAFTPNNDGLNDVFKTPANSNSFSSYHLTVFNRWGQKIFESKDALGGWNGRVNGVLQSPGTFIWYCTYSLRDSGLKESKHGTVTLLR